MLWKSFYTMGSWGKGHWADPKELLYWSLFLTLTICSLVDMHFSRAVLFFSRVASIYKIWKIRILYYALEPSQNLVKYGQNLMPKEDSGNCRWHWNLGCIVNYNMCVAGVALLRNQWQYLCWGRILWAFFIRLWYFYHCCQAEICDILQGKRFQLCWSLW